jgi:Spy/CpxP family protein refolding chaperone
MQSNLKNVAAVSFLAVLAAVVASAQEKPASNMEILRDKIKADKKLLIAENLKLTESQAKAFWPIYDEYQKELQALNQRLSTLIQSYAKEYNAATVTDDKAKSLLNEAIAVDEAEVALRKKYAQRLEGVIPAKEAARYLQMENKIRALIRYDLATEIPLVQ